MRIGITYDLRSDYLRAGYGELETAEFDRADTIDAIAGALSALGHVPERLGNVRQLAARLVNGERWDLVFNLCEGLSGFGREAQVPALLEAYGVPYTFSDPLTCALTLHKGMAKHVLRDNGLPTPDFALIETAAEAARIELTLPLFVKPVAEGTSKGVDGGSVIRSRRELQRRCARLLQTYDQPVLVERYLPGREFTVGMLGTGAEAATLGTVEVRLNRGADPGVYSYRNKERCEELVRYQLLEHCALRAELEALALAAWRTLGCRDAGRVDLRLDECERPSILEINPLAGLHPQHSDLPIMCQLAGGAYEALIENILRSASRRVLPAGRPARELAVAAYGAAALG